MTGNAFKPDWAAHPGEVLAEHMQARGMSQADMARATGASRKLVCDIVHGRNPVMAKTAIRLERVFELNAETWLRLQNLWDLHHKPPEGPGHRRQHPHGVRGRQRGIVDNLSEGPDDHE